ncbi:MAG: MBL fold metallo-hydrolase [Myxococcota bacterium]|nr:MBL fold metallo-hydrolase [Myxococcota bacterium]
MIKKRRISSIQGNSQRLDGGAMFGNAPRELWSKWLPPDEKNRVPLCCRAMLVEESDGRRILFEAGIGAFFDPKLKNRFGVVESEHVLLQSLQSHGISHHEIDLVVLSHMHFDHTGGLLSTFNPDAPTELLFPKATFIVGEEAWQRMCHPHPRDKASFIPQMKPLLENSGRLTIVKADDAEKILGPGYRFHLSHGHTPGLLLAEISMPGGPVVFAGDLIPATPWVHLPITMGYDRFPELLIDEKTRLLEDLLHRQGRLFYTHDHDVAISNLTQDERGRFKADRPLNKIIHLDH